MRSAMRLILRHGDVPSLHRVVVQPGADCGQGFGGGYPCRSVLLYGVGFHASGGYFGSKDATSLAGVCHDRLSRVLGQEQTVIR
jgi:hypothetical protein